MKFFAVLTLALFTTPALADPPSTHGMLIVGNEAIYASHLPMFHRPHDYQVIFELDFSAPGIDANALYRQDRHESGSRVYTIEPQRFDLPAVIKAGTPFKAHLYRGHFERGGQKILANVTVSFRKIIHFRKFSPGASHPGALEYLLFGSRGEFFLAHLITAAPDFDQLLGVTLMTRPAGPVLSLPGRAQTQPLQEGETLPGLKVITEYYFETGDLAEGH